MVTGLEVPWRRDRKAMVLFVLIYAIVRIAGSVAETRYAGGTGFSPWHPMAGLDVIFFLICGWRWWPVPLALGVLRIALFNTGLHATPFANVAALAIDSFLIALATKIVVDLGVRFPLKSLKDVGRFVVVLGIVAPLVVGACATAIFTLTGRFPVEQINEQYLRVVAGLTTSIVVFVPTIAQLLVWKDPQVTDDTVVTRPDSADLWLGLLATFAVVVGEYVFGLRSGRPVLELSFLPLAWLALRNGMHGAVLGILVVEVTSTLLHVIFGIPIGAQTQYDGYVLAMALMALLLGSVTGERDRLLERLGRQAYVDDLTGLPNRDRLLAWLERHRNSPLVLVIIDIDDMRLLNEGVGRGAADRVLREFASRLRIGLPSSHLVARVSADEFAVVAVDQRSPHSLIAEIRHLIEPPFESDGSRLFIAASAGAVQVARSGDAEDLMRRADLALHRAKRNSTRTAIYSPDLQSASAAPLLVVELHRALERDEFECFYQPICRYHAASDRWELIGAEALLRWIHPQRGVLAPDQFLDLLERLSISDRVGWNAIEQSLAHVSNWRKRVPDFRVWVNLFARQALDAGCAGRVGTLIESARVAPQALVLEISERIVVNEERDISALAQELQRIGVATAIDDFGTGGSSLGRIRDVPVEILKIDRSFVNRSEVDAKAKAVAAAVVRLAAELGMTVVAEGVENALQVDSMLEVGCQYAQGYALGHPLPAHLFERALMDGFFTPSRTAAG